MTISLATPIQFVKGVGPRRAGMFLQAGILTTEDLISYKPFRYEDRSHFRLIRDLKPQEQVVIEGTVVVTGRYITPLKKVRIFEMMVADRSGSLPVKFFNQPYLNKVFRKGQRVILFGIPRLDSYDLRVTLVNPDYELMTSSSERTVHTGRVVPIYRRIGKLTTRTLRRIIFEAISNLEPEIEDPLPGPLRRKYGFPDRRLAFEQVHFPACPKREERHRCLSELESSSTPAHRRLIFEEFFFFQLSLQVMKRHRELLPKRRVAKLDDRIHNTIQSFLPFHPTGAQKRVLKEILDDLVSPKVMNRLLQGEVGSGKTIVALQAMVLMIENAYQTALMAPTEILAEQHYRTVSQYLSRTPYRFALFTSRVQGKQRRSTLAQVESGEIDLVVGTHAMIQKGVKFKELAFIVVDEQHRFGVVQRSQLMEKGDRPDTLVMTATPIPRSLALTLYGDFDLSLIDEMPPGRQPTKTLVRGENGRKDAYARLEEELKKGRQAYVVYPLVEESERVDLKAATEMAECLQQIFEGYTVGLIHGRLKPDKKETLMHRFRDGKIHILASTTVVEVGIDVPNASVMLVEHAERFGLSQLHQLRGRVGRGPYPSLCILMYDRVTTREAFQRLSVMRRTNDGFKIAEKDLEIRGPGQLVGTRQSGLPEFNFGHIVRDRKLLEMARSGAAEYLTDTLKSANRSEQAMISQVATWWRERYGLSNVG